MDFANIIREEAVLFLLDLPRGEEVTILAQKKKDGERVAGVTCVPYTALLSSRVTTASRVVGHLVLREAMENHKKK